MSYSSKILSNIDRISRISTQDDMDSFIYCFSEYIAKYVEGSYINESYLNSFIDEYVKTIQIASQKKDIVDYFLSFFKDSLGSAFSIIFDNYLKIYNGDIDEVSKSSYNFMKTEYLVIIIYDELKNNNIKLYGDKLENYDHETINNMCKDIISLVGGEKLEK